MTTEPMTRERAEQLARMAEANDLEALDEDRAANFLLAQSLRARAADYRRLATEILAQLDLGEIGAFFGLCLCALCAYGLAVVL